eukprot:GHVL01023524.1.p1 GENE.GHVL01023524.1~~GHVL01023524.1.p1  ORF type:complete len:342 (-),score=37.45 GHVL01023524.1:1293-2318(-)
MRHRQSDNQSQTNSKIGTVNCHHNSKPYEDIQAPNTVAGLVPGSVKARRDPHLTITLEPKQAVSGIGKPNMFVRSESFKDRSQGISSTLISSSNSVMSLSSQGRGIDYNSNGSCHLESRYISPKQAGDGSAATSKPGDTDKHNTLLNDEHSKLSCTVPNASPFHASSSKSATCVKTHNTGEDESTSNREMDYGQRNYSGRESPFQTHHHTTTPTKKHLSLSQGTKDKKIQNRTLIDLVSTDDHQPDLFDSTTILDLGRPGWKWKPPTIVAGGASSARLLPRLTKHKMHRIECRRKVVDSSGVDSAIPSKERAIEENDKSRNNQLRWFTSFLCAEPLLFKKR